MFVHFPKFSYAIAIAIILLSLPSYAQSASVGDCPLLNESQTISEPELASLYARAEEGDGCAQLDLGRIYGRGQSVPSDEAEAVHWTRLAANQGSATAQYNLAIMYFNGQGVVQDFERAAYYTRLAAERGHADAQYSLGFLYYTGQGAPQDYSEAAYWFGLAAEQGVAVAQASIATMYENGIGVEQDYSEAVHWFRLAAEQGNATGQHGYGLMLDLGHGVGENNSEAARWYRLAAEQGHAGSQHNLGIMYEMGEGVRQDYVEAARWYRLAADQGNAGAQYNLGNFYVEGLGVTQSDEEALRLYRQAAEQGYSDAQDAYEFLLAHVPESNMRQATAGTVGESFDSQEGVDPAVCLEDTFSDSCIQALQEIATFLMARENREVLYAILGGVLVCLLLWLLATVIPQSSKAILAPIAQLFVGGLGYIFLGQSFYKVVLGFVVWVIPIIIAFSSSEDPQYGMFIPHLVLVFDTFMLSRRVAKGQLLNGWTFFWNRTIPNYAELIESGTKPMTFYGGTARFTIDEDEVLFKQMFNKQAARLADVVAVETEPQSWAKVAGFIASTAASFSDNPMSDRLGDYFSNYICLVLKETDKKGRNKRFPSVFGLPNSNAQGFSDRDLAFILAALSAENIPVVKKYEAKEQ